MAMCHIHNTAIWYILWPFGIVSPVSKNLATLDTMTEILRLTLFFLFFRRIFLAPKAISKISPLYLYSLILHKKTRRENR
jgi:hypothetical protein